MLTDLIISTAAQDVSPKVFMLWGAHAQAKAPLIEVAQAGHAVLQCNHPSPLAASRPPVPFLGCGHFSAALRFIGQGSEGRPAPMGTPNLFDLS